MEYVLMGGPRSRWTAEGLSAIMDKYKAGGMQVINMIIGGINNVIYGKPGADAEIENVIQGRGRPWRFRPNSLRLRVIEESTAALQVALHPNDPPVPVSRGSEQLMASFAQWKEYINLVKSPYNGMTFDCGVSRGDGRGSGRGCKVAG